MAIHQAEAVWENEGAQTPAAEWLASAVVASYNETLGHLLAQAGHAASVRSKASVVTEEGFIYKVDLSVWVDAPDLDQLTVRRFAEKAKGDCSVARALKARVDLLSVIATDVQSLPPVALTPLPLRTRGLIQAAKQG